MNATLSPSSPVVLSSAPLMVICAEAGPAPNANATPHGAIHFSALQLPLAKLSPVRMRALPLSGSSLVATGESESVSPRPSPVLNTLSSVAHQVFSSLDRAVKTHSVPSAAHRRNPVQADRTCRPELARGADALAGSRRVRDPAGPDVPNRYRRATPDRPGPPKRSRCGSLTWPKRPAQGPKRRHAGQRRRTRPGRYQAVSAPARTEPHPAGRPVPVRSAPGDGKPRTRALDGAAPGRRRRRRPRRLFSAPAGEPATVDALPALRRHPGRGA